MDDILVENISEKVLSGELFLRFDFVSFDAKLIQKQPLSCYLVSIDSAFARSLSDEEYRISEEKTEEILEIIVNKYLKQFGLCDKTKKYFNLINSIKLSTRHMLPDVATDKKYDFDLLYECGLGDNPDYLIVASWKANLTNLMKEMMIMNKEKIKVNKALFDSQIKTETDIYANENCLLVSLRACCCRCGKKDKDNKTCCGGEYIIDKHGYCEYFFNFCIDKDLLK